MSDVFKIYEDSLNISINNIKRILNKKDFNNDDISKLSDNLKNEIFNNYILILYFFN